MAEQGNQIRSSISSDGAKLKTSDESKKIDASTDMKDLTTKNDSDNFSTPNNVIFIHSEDVLNTPPPTFHFLKLPAELRMRIYYYVFCIDHKWHFDTFRQWPRLWSREYERRPRGRSRPRAWLDNEGFAVGGDAMERILSFLRTCRKIYQEARYEIFKHNTFSFDYDKRATLTPLLPVQKSAIQNIWVNFDASSSDRFGSVGPGLYKWLSGFEGLRSVEVRLYHEWRFEPIDHDLRGYADNWEKVISPLQDLGSLSWVGTMNPTHVMRCRVHGCLHLRLGRQRSAERVNSKPADEGLTGNELKFLYWNNRVSWQELPEEWRKK